MALHKIKQQLKQLEQTGVCQSWPLIGYIDEDGREDWHIAYGNFESKKEALKYADLMGFEVGAIIIDSWPEMQAELDRIAREEGGG